MNSLRKLFYLLTVLAMLTVTFSGIGCGGGDGNSTTDDTSDYGNDGGQSEGGSYTNDGAAGGVDVPMPAGSGTSGDSETE